MDEMRMTGSASGILAVLGRKWPGAPGMPGVKRKVLDYQMVALWVLAQRFNRAGARILEIGTGHGGSGYMLAHGARLAEVISVTIDENGASNAGKLWESSGLTNIRVELVASWDYLKRSRGKWDMVWIDGDHNQIRRDLPWFNRLADGGLLVCHDYSPQDSARPSAICYATLNEMREKLGRPFDVEIIDEEKTGLVGFYRRAGEKWA